MRSRADFEKPCACTVSFLVSSPPPRILTGTPLRVARRAPCSASRSTAAPSSKRFSRSERLTAWVCVRNGSNGIDIFLFGPRSLRIRMWIGFWPPSKRARLLAPEREPAPLRPVAAPAVAAGGGAVALLAAAGGLAGAGALAAAHALARPARARSGLEIVKADLLGHDFSSTATRWRTAWTIPRSCGESSRSTDLPMPRRPSDRSVSRCGWLAPLDDLTWVMRRLTRAPPPHPRDVRRQANSQGTRRQ